MAGERNALADQRAILADREVQSVFDVGANDGETTACYRSAFPTATIHSFEPFPKEFDKLKQRYAEDARVIPVRAALSNHAGQTSFYVNQNSATNSLLPASVESGYWSDSPNDVKTVRQIEVPVTTIHTYCQQNGIEAIDILKIDVQGSEQLVLEGAAEELHRGSIALVQAELQLVPVYEEQVSFYELAGFMSQYGYRLFGMYNMAYAVNGQAKWCDAIFLSPNTRARYIERTKGGRDSLAGTGEGHRKRGETPSTVSAKENELHLLQQHILALQEDTKKCHEDLARLERDKRQAEAEWQSVQASAGWRLLNLWRTVRDRMAPASSMRRRLYDSLIGKLRQRKAG